MMQWDFQNKEKSGWTGKNSLVLEVPLHHLRPSVIYSVPCDRILQRAYCLKQVNTVRSCMYWYDSVEESFANNKVQFQSFTHL